MNVRFARGDVVAVRELWKGRVWTARPWIVVEDAPARLVLWIPQGAPTKVPPPPRIPRDDWELEDGLWKHDAVRVTRPGSAHSILQFASADHWYVNLERPFTRSALGFDYLDLELDLICRPDGSHELADEDDFAGAQRRGVISPAEAAAVRAEADRVVAAWPFPTGFEEFRPDPGWELPQLPPGWDVV
jgi:hypothetical protein